MRVGGLGWPHLALYWLHEWYLLSNTLNTSNRGDKPLLRLISRKKKHPDGTNNVLEQHAAQVIAQNW